jgi:hypothetical protein
LGPIDSFDGIFVDGDLDKIDDGLPPSELKSELDLSVKNMLSSQPSSKESVRCQNKSDGILGPHPPSFSEIGKIKDRIYDDNLMESDGMTRLVLIKLSMSSIIKDMPSL